MAFQVVLYRTNRPASPGQQEGATHGVGFADGNASYPPTRHLNGTSETETAAMFNRKPPASPMPLET